MASAPLMAEEEVEERVPETPSVQSVLLVGEGGTIREHDEQYHLEFDTPDGTSFCYLVPITEIEGRVLCAVPFLAWHRISARRLLPGGALTKAVLVEVPGLDLADPEHPEETAVKVWVGFLHEDLVKEITPGIPEEPGILDFGEELGTKVQPAASSLVDIADEHFKFVTAQSGAPKKPTPKRRAKVAMESRVTSLEETLKSIQETLQDLPKKLQEEKPKRGATAKSKADARVPGGEAGQIPGLDPGVVAAARTSGMPEEHLTRLGQMFARPERMVEPLLRKKGKKDILSESEDEIEEEEGEAAEEEGEGKEKSPPIERAVLQLTKLVKNMAKTKKTGGGLEGILEKVDGVSSTSEAAGSGGGSRSKAAAYKRLKEALETHPEWIYQSIEMQMEEDYNQMRTLPGGGLLPTTSRGWVEHRSRILHYPGTIRMAWALAGVHDALKSNNVPLARAKVALSLAAVDQSSLDGGAWTLAQEMLLENAPPYHSFANKRNPDPTEQPSTRLVEERFLEVMLWRLKDKDHYLESRKRLMQNNRMRLGNFDKDKEKEDPPKKGGKGGAKKGKGEKGGREDAQQE